MFFIANYLHCTEKTPQNHSLYQLGIEGLREYKHVLANISHLRYVAIATQPVHRLQIRPIAHN